MTRTVVAAGSAVTAVLCAWTASGYLNIGRGGDVPALGGWFLTIGLLGAASLVATGLAQYVAGPRTRVFVLVVLAFLSAGYIAANAFGLYVLGSAGAPGTVPVGLHRAGMWVGTVLFVGVMLEAMRVIQAQRPLEEQAG